MNLSVVMSQLFSLLREGEDILFQLSDTDSIKYGRIISRLSSGELIVSTYSKLDYDPNDYDEDSDLHFSQLDFLIPTSTLTIHERNVINVIFIFKRSEIIHTPFPLNLEGITNAFHIKELTTPFQSIPPLVFKFYNIFYNSNHTASSYSYTKFLQNRTAT